MPADPLEIAAGDVLGAYRLPSPCQCIPLGSAGGFSGARLWRVLILGQILRLKAWPADFQDSERLGRVHRWMGMACLHGLNFVPVVQRARDERSWQVRAARFWDLTEWMSGTADFRLQPSLERVQAACQALASLHHVWQRESLIETPPSVIRRMQSVREWDALLRSGWRPEFSPEELDPVTAVARRIWLLLPPFLPEIRLRLECWTDKRRLQPCICDIWHDHVLFSGANVSGIIDYGSMRIDHPATDLARMLGSLIGDHQSMFAVGIAAYRQVRPFDDVEATLARVLDWTGMVLGAANWLHRLYREKRYYEDRTLVAKRMQALFDRMEYFASSPSLAKSFRCL